MNSFNPAAIAAALMAASPLKLTGFGRRKSTIKGRNHAERVRLDAKDRAKKRKARKLARRSRSFNHARAKQ